MTDQKVLSPEERERIARNVVANLGPDKDVVALYRQYCMDEMWARYEGQEVTAEEVHRIYRLAEMYADLATDTFKYDLPAIRVFMEG